MNPFPTAAAARAAIRAGQWRGATAGMVPGRAQANLVVVREPVAQDFLDFCKLNPVPCPVLEVVEPGRWEPRRSAPGADLRTDLPGYRVYRNGKLDATPEDVRDVWGKDLVAFLLGCSFTFEDALVSAGFALPHVGSGRSVAMYRTRLECTPAGPFHGPLVVSMRWIPEDRVDEATRITAAFPLAHGAPIHVGSPAAIGILDLDEPDYGDAWPRPAGHVPMFWGCGVTPQAVAVASGLDLVLTQAPGRMFITDLPDLPG